VKHLDDYVKNVSIAIDVAVLIAACLYVLKEDGQTLWKWLTSAVKGCSATTCPMCGQSVSSATGSSSINTVPQD
jgi:hypothetical protein